MKRLNGAAGFNYGPNINLSHIIVNNNKETLFNLQNRL